MKMYEIRLYGGGRFRGKELVWISDGPSGEVTCIKLVDDWRTMWVPAFRVKRVREI